MNVNHFQVSNHSLQTGPFGGYQILSKLGAGGMGDVYQAHDSKLGRDVAIKTLPRAFASDPDRLARFRREARVLASLNHPNIAMIYDLEKFNGVNFLVLELVPGETLAERLSRGALAVEEALSISSQIAEALETAHEKGIIHRDLKPSNVKITPGGRVKVLDFGLAKTLQSAPAEADTQLTTRAMQNTHEGTVLGTPAYMSPEQTRGKPLDKRTDIWSFGCVLYELLTGRQAFQGETISDYMAAILSKEPEWNRLPQTTPPGVRSLLRRCLQKDPQRRMRDIGDARLELEEAQAKRVGQAARLTRHALRGPLVAIGSLTVALVLLLSASRLGWFGRPTAAPPRQFRERQITGNATEDPVFVAAISPDGKYLAYTDFNGIHLLLIETGEARVLPVPEQFCFR